MSEPAVPAWASHFHVTTVWRDNLSCVHQVLHKRTKCPVDAWWHPWHIWGILTSWPTHYTIKKLTLLTSYPEAQSDTSSNSDQWLFFLLTDSSVWTRRLIKPLCFCALCQRVPYASGLDKLSISADLGTRTGDLQVLKLNLEQLQDHRECSVPYVCLFSVAL